VDDKQETIIEAVDNYLTNRKKAWPLKRMATAFKFRHVNRYSYSLIELNTPNRSLSNEGSLPGIVSSRSFKQIMPQDNRRYKKTSMEYLTNFTFSPKLNKHIQLEEKELKQKRRKELNKDIPEIEEVSPKKLR